MLFASVPRNSRLVVVVVVAAANIPHVVYNIHLSSKKIKGFSLYLIFSAYYIFFPIIRKRSFASLQFMKSSGSRNTKGLTNSVMHGMHVVQKGFHGDSWIIIFFWGIQMFVKYM